MTASVTLSPRKVLEERIALLEEITERKRRTECRENFMPFVKAVFPGFIEGRHHAIMANAFERVARGELKRLIINMPPRHTKSEFASYLLPAWFIGRNPKVKIIEATHTAELAMGFGRKVRDLITEPKYQDIFPDISLKEDTKAAGRWMTSDKGEYFAAGVGGAVTGRGADLLIIDDPHSEQDALSSTAFDNHYEWYTSGPRQRLQPGGAIIIVMTRWGKKDLTGRITSRMKMRDGKAEWEVIELPAIMPSGLPLWPEYWALEDLLSVKEDLPVSKWEAQWQQKPTGVEGAIISRDQWQNWEHEKIPELKFIIQAYDTAFLKVETADYTAITTWGIFSRGPELPDCILLLDAKRGRWSFPELKEIAIAEHRYWNTDLLVIEAKASGQPLADELILQNLPVATFSPSRGRDKHARMHMVAPMFAGGRVYAPLDAPFVDEIIEEVTSFPNGDNDDYCDSMTLALMRFRQGGFIRLDGEEDLEPDDAPARIMEYY